MVNERAFVECSVTVTRGGKKFFWKDKAKGLFWIIARNPVDHLIFSEKLYFWWECICILVD